MLQPRTALFCFVFWTWASIGQTAAVGSTSPSLGSRADVNLTLLSNASAIVQSLDFTSNCSLSILWYDHLPESGAGSGNDAINIDFLRSALPNEYQNENNDEITSFYDDMSTGALSGLGWIGIAKDDIETTCIAPTIDRQITLANLDPEQNCTATAIFLSSLGWVTGAQNYTGGNANSTSWLEFLRASLPAADRNNVTDLELLVYRDFFFASESIASINTFLNKSFDACQKDICEVQGYTGNPEIGGIGVISSYTVEAALITLYFIAINFQIWMDAQKSGTTPSRVRHRIRKALDKASDELADGALFFSLSISTAGWLAFVHGTSYYEKLVFTSANVFALSALFAFLGMFTKEGRKKRGEYILAAMILAILVESGIQYIVYLKEPNDKYDDYNCLHLQFIDQGYHPTVFEGLFFLLLGLSVIAGIVGLIWLAVNSIKGDNESTPMDATNATNATNAAKDTLHIFGISRHGIEDCVTGTRLFVQVVAIVVMWVELVYLWKIRKIMSKIAGPTWSEGSWGFGQILALFIWLPPIVDILGWLFLPSWMLGGDKSPKCNCCGNEAGDPCECKCHDRYSNPPDPKLSLMGEGSQNGKKA